MPRLRLFLLAAAAMLLLGAAPAWGYTRPVLSESLSTPHFVVHFETSGTAYHIDQTIAGDVAAYAERAYTQDVTQFGYPAPLDDGDGKTDIYVVDLLVPTTGQRSLTLPDNNAATRSSAFIELDYKTGLNLHAVAHAVFDAIGLGVWNPTNRSFLEGAADWSAYTLDGFAGFSDNTGSYDVSLDCWDVAFPFVGHLCGHVGESVFANSFGFDDGEIGSARWPFFEYLTERYGVKTMLTLLQNGFTSGSQNTSPAALLDAYLATQGTSLSAFFDDWSLAAMSGAYSAVPLQPVAPKPYTSIFTGSLASLNPNASPLVPPITSGDIPKVTIPVDHLAVRYLALTKGDGSDTGPCFAATLALKVTLPAGVTSKPYFQWGERNALGKLVQAAVPLTVSGSTATATIQSWDTCKWARTVALLSLPNDSLSADALDFTVEGTLTIDTSTVGAGSSAPAQNPMPGAVVASPTQDVVPTIDVLGPGTIHVDSNDTQLRVVLSASGPGNVQVTLGSISLGTFALRTGTNLVRVPLTGPAEQALVAARTTGLTLTLTPLALPGGAGSSIGCTVVLDPLLATTTSSTPTPKAKGKTKLKAKPKRHVVTKRRVRR